MAWQSDGQADGRRPKRRLTLPDHELVWRFGPSGGPGGQHANTANTRAEVVFEIGESQSLTPFQRERLDEAFGPRIRVVCDDSRSQSRNRQVAIERLYERIEDALKPRPQRRKTRPTRGSKERRLKAKKIRGQNKRNRSGNYDY